MSVITGTRYKNEMINDKQFDVIIIGSGLSALSMGSYLAQKNKKVLLLERHYTAGGFTHMFKRKRYMWDVGVHYVGEVHKENTFFNKLFNHITQGKLKWAKLDDVYDKIFIGDEHYDFREGVTNFKQSLYKKFSNSEDQKAIDKYIDLCFKVNKSATWNYLHKILPGPLAKLTRPLLGRTFRKFASKTTAEVLKGITNNKQLTAVLTAQYGDQGLPPGQSSFVVQALVNKHFFNGGSYPVGGSVNFAKTMIPIIEAAGGNVLTHAEVKELILQNKKAIGVELANGDKIYAPKIVSSIGIHNTFSHLLPKDYSNKKILQAKAESLKPSIGHICLYIGLNGSPQELDLPKSNFWIYPHNDYDKALEDFCNDINAPLPLTYISFPGAKDPHWQETNPEHSTVEIITFAPWEWFEKWEDKKWKKRGDDYNELKDLLSKRLLDQLYKYVPKTKGNVDYHELSTPLSTKHFCNYQHGEIYGLDHTPKRFLADWLGPHTPIKNFYLTGQDVMTVGIGSSALSGILTVAAMEKKNTLSQFM